MKKLASVFFNRLVQVALVIALQLVLLVVVTTYFSEYYWPFHWLVVALSLVAVLWIVNSHSNAGFKIAWIILILLVPVMGGILYLLLGGGKLFPGVRRRVRVMEGRLTDILRPDRKAARVEKVLGAGAGNQVRYLEEHASCPVYQDTRVDYYALGDDCRVPLLEALEGAERYIFLEYFIIDRGIFWNEILDILKRKVMAGVDVRVMYDDIGSMKTLPMGYARELRRHGIQCVAFNRFIPILSTAMNNRDHRKICSVDGKIAFTGGLNLADEYINKRERFGHWKDSVVRLEGPAAWSMTVMFLTMWDMVTKKKRMEDPERFRPAETPRFPGEGWVQPYTDCPWNAEPVGETVYLNMIAKAERYIYICTPYLIPDDALVTALTAAAKSGVDVRIMTPHIPDKKMIFQVTRAHYEPLLRDGVKIFEYTPGFLHSKSFAVDDRYGTVGSVNLDYRSLFLHFENGVLLLNSPVVEEIKNDFLTTERQCQPFTLEDCRQVKLPLRILRSILRIFAPLF